MKTPLSRKPHLFRYLLIGFFTVAPLWVTWLVFDFLFGLLTSTGVRFNNPPHAGVEAPRR